jgi:hypothetical protein
MRTLLMQRAARALLVAGLVSIAMSGAAEAQSIRASQKPHRVSLSSHADCWSPQPRSAGVAVGLPSPSLELSSAEGHVGGGPIVAGRVDLPMAGPLRVRLEASTAWWNTNVTPFTTVDGQRVTGETASGWMTESHLSAFGGFTMGQPGFCGHLFFGPGLYAISGAGLSLVRPGFGLMAGMDIPISAYGVVQVDGGLHAMTGTRTAWISSTSILAPTLLIGWAYRF